MTRLQRCGNATLSLIIAWVCAAHLARAADQAWSDHPKNGLVAITLSIPDQFTAEPKAWDPRLEWRGVVNVTLTNYSKQVVRFVESDWKRDYRIDVLDAAGNQPQKTQEGLALRAADDEEAAPPPSHILITLQSGQSYTGTIYIGLLFRIAPHAEYTVRVRRTAGLPRSDNYGNQLPEPELRTSLEIHR